MKVLAARPRDQDDIRLLAEHLGLSTAAEVLGLTAEIFPDERVPERARLLVEDLLDQG